MFVRGVVFFPGWKVAREQAKGADVWVMNPEHLGRFLEHEDRTLLSPEHVRLIHTALRQCQN